MRIYAADDYKGMSRQAANIISAHVITKPDCVLGLTARSTPAGAYRQLAEWFRKGDLSFAETRSVCMDEYCGLSPHHEQSCHRFMRDHFFKYIDIKPENTYMPDGLAFDESAECARYNRVIRALGGIDLQLLGLGRNGHVGFNEPGLAFELETHVADLADCTLQDCKRRFPKAAAVPRRALTVGIKNIMQARKVLMVVSGEDKADIVYRAFAGPIVPEVPASILQLHPDMTLVGDRAALHKLLEAGAASAN